MALQLHNTLSGSKEPFTPSDPTHVKIYVCGPTVYARPHIGNARSVVVYDVLYRLLSHLYPNVTYVRNITDVDDKINAAAIERGITIQQLTAEVTQQFHDDMDALNCLRPTHEPRATEHIDGMIAMIETLIDQGHAYVGNDGQHVLFDVTSYADYGKLSGRLLDDQQAGARIAVEDYKRHAGDFVLWKPADDEDDASSKFDSPWGIGRPGWHIECSVMSSHFLGADFDIHGGGADLKFPHHENEIAQSRCANHDSHYAKYWVHNGFLTVNGEKMSKSLGNFVTVRDLLDRGIKGEVIRLALLMSKYNEPLDWNDKKVEEAQKLLNKWYRAIAETPQTGKVTITSLPSNEVQEDMIVRLLCDDLNFPQAIKELFSVPKQQLKQKGEILGILQQSPKRWFQDINEKIVESVQANVSLDVQLIYGPESIMREIEARIAAKKSRDFATADRIRDELKAQGILLEDRPDGTTDWRRA